MKIHIIAAVAALGALLSACTTVTLPAYTVSGSQSIDGNVGSVTATYTPPGNSKSTQIRTTTVGSLMLTEPVSSYVSNAFRLELRSAGMKMDTGTCNIVLKVNDYAIDDLGFNATFISDIDYEMTKDKPIFNKNIRVTFTTSKFVVPEVIFASLRSALAQNFDKVMQDAAFRAALATNCR